MNYKLTILVLVCNGLLLTGCGGGSSSSSSSDTTNNTPSSTTSNSLSDTTNNTPSSIANNESLTTKDGLNATWLEYGKCKALDKGSQYITFTINSIDAILSEKLYTNTTCNENGLKSHADSTFSLTTGRETKGSDRVSTIELDLTRTGALIHKGEVILPTKGVTFYTMYRIDTQGRLFIAEGTEIRTGKTIEDRANDFTQSVPYLKQ